MITSTAPHRKLTKPFVDIDVTSQLISDAMERWEVIDAMHDLRPSMSLTAYKQSLYV